LHFLDDELEVILLESAFENWETQILIKQGRAPYARNGSEVVDFLLRGA